MSGLQQFHPILPFVDAECVEKAALNAWNVLLIDLFKFPSCTDMAWPPLEGMGRRQWKSGLSPDGTHWNCRWPSHKETGKTMAKHCWSVGNHSDVAQRSWYLWNRLSESVAFAGDHCSSLPDKFRTSSYRWWGAHMPSQWMTFLP